jgi:hypothetical protein
MLFHDNTYTGKDMGGSMHIGPYREDYGFKWWDAANGKTNIDKRDTTDYTGNGLGGGTNGKYASGTCTAGTYNVTETQNTAGFLSLTDSGNSFPDLVATRPSGSVFCAINTSHTFATGTAAGFHPSSFIWSNTAHTCLVSASSNAGPAVSWGTGDNYEIYILESAVDQAGRGRGDLITDSNPAGNNIPWPNQAQEPVYAYSNAYGAGQVGVASEPAAGGGTGMPTVMSGRDFFNLGAKTPDVVPSEVLATYVTALNGEHDYTGPYTYPHPLVNPLSPNTTLFTGPGSVTFTGSGSATF